MVTDLYRHGATRAFRSGIEMRRLTGRSLRPDRSESATIIDILAPTALALLVYSGQIKANPLLSWIPFDLTAICAVLVCALAALDVPNWKVSRRQLIYVFGVALTFILGSLPAGYAGYGATKVATMFTITFLALVLAPVLIFVSERRGAVFVIAIFVIGTCATIFTFLSPEYAAEYSNRLVFAGTDTIGTARFAGGSLAVAIVLAVALPPSHRARPWLWLSAFPLASLLLLTGSRGPLLSLVGTFIALFVISSAFRPRLLRQIVPVLTVALFALISATVTKSDGLTRTANFVAGEGDASTSARSVIWGVALREILRDPIGVGWGGFRQLLDSSAVAVNPAIVYPHNMIIEVFVEGGWIPGVVITAILVYSAVRALTLARSPWSVAFAALLVFSICNAMVSGDVNSARLMWVLLGLSLAAFTNGEDGYRSSVAAASASFQLGPHRVRSGGHSERATH